jgi:hypothetical protein
MTQEVDAHQVTEAERSASVEVTRGGTEPERLRRVEKETESIDGRLRKLSSGIREEIDDAIATELGHPESLSKAVELKDIGWALAGIAVDAVGIVVQLCA